jgi:hypothetical protein
MRIVVQDLSTKMNGLRISSADKCHLAHIKRAYFHTCHAAYTYYLATTSRKDAGWRLFDRQKALVGTGCLIA